ncbi:MAG: arginine--tRNA ligase [Alphaproteobacteria bacterium]|nr:arginine--tRNA ligase [Alphaproteobacteria bacterium]
MNYVRSLRAATVKAIEGLMASGALPPDLVLDAVAIDMPRDPSHGDVATNAALVLAKGARKPPRELAGIIAQALRSLDGVVAAEVAGPGFINLRFDDRFWHERLHEAVAAGAGYGTADVGAGTKVNVEYVSANPTGPLHVGHARGAVVGDVLANMLAAVGNAVTREYYINDAGAQIDQLARALHWRYREAAGETPGPMPEGLYPGEYMVPVAHSLHARDGGAWLGRPEADWLGPLGDYAIAAMMDLIRDDLAVLGIHQDVFSSERAGVARGGVDAALVALDAKGLIYQGVLEPPKGSKPDDWEPREQTLFRSTGFGDDVDRPIRKSDGSWTYFAGDIVYHLDKLNRGFDVLIDVWGADHGGYVKRMQAAVKALSDGRVPLDIKLCQLVNLLDNGQPVRMSKRAGTFVTLRDVVDAVGKDVVRFVMLTRRNDMHLDFDLTKVREQSKDNPVFYVQYAHARCCSVLRNAVETMPDLVIDHGAAPLDRLVDAGEIALIRMLASWPRTLEGAAESHEPHRLAYFLGELAAAFHGHWNRGGDIPSLRFLVAEDRGLTQARLALVAGVRAVIAAGLGIFGVAPVEQLR